MQLISWFLLWTEIFYHTSRWRCLKPKRTGDNLAYKRKRLTPEEEIARIRSPRQGEIFAVIEDLVGSDKLRVKCSDGKERIARIPGKFRKRVWMRVGDLILIKPWKVMSDKRADVAWRYTKTQAKWLQDKGYLKNISVQ